MNESGFLSGLDHATRARLSAVGARRVYARGAMIFAQGLPGTGILIIETGRVEIERVTEQGRRLVLGNLGPGDLVGEMAAIDQGPRSASVLAATPVTGVLLSRDEIETFLLEHPRLMLSMMRDLVGKLRLANTLAEDRAITDGSARLARCLLRLAERWGAPQQGEALRLTESFSQAALGEIAGLSRENVNRRLSQWARNGWVGQHGGRLCILTPSALERIAEAGGDDPDNP